MSLVPRRAWFRPRGLFGKYVVAFVGLVALMLATVLGRGAAVRGLVAQRGLGQHSAMTGSSSGGLISCAVALAAAASQFLLSLQLAIA